MAPAAEPSSARRIAALLRTEGPALLARWRELVLADPAIARARPDSEPVLLDHIPGLIAGLADALEASGQQAGRSDMAGRHAGLRPAAGYSLSEALLELSHLRLAILERIVGAGLPVSWEAGLAIHQAIDCAMATLADELGRLQNQVLNAVVEQSVDGVIMADQEGRLRIVNPEAERQHGVGLRAIEAGDWPESYGLLHPDGTPMALGELALFRALQGDRVRHATWLVRRPDGAIRRLTGNATPLFLPDGTPMGAVLTTRDETDRFAADKERERLLRRERAARQQVTSILESITEAFYALDRSWCFTYVNHEAERLLQHGREDLIGRLIWASFPETVGSPIQEHYERAMAAGKAEHFETYYPPLATWFEVHAYPSDDGLAVYFLDITARRAAAEALHESAVRFRTMADNIAQLAWMADEKGSIFWYNKRWFDYTGTTLEEMQGWGWQKAHHPDHVQRVVEKIRRCFESGELWEDTFPLRGKDGTYRWFLSRATPIRDEAGRIVRWFGTNTDITERLQAEEERERLLERERQARQEAEAAVRMRDEVLAIVSHDLRNPLTAIDLNAVLMQTRPMSADELARRLGAVRRAAQRAGHLIRDLLDVSRLEAGQALIMDPAPQEVAGLVREVCELTQPQAAAKLIQIDCHVDPATPTVVADRHRLLQALSNLLDNAIKFSPEGGRIRVQVSPVAAGVCFAVSDTGPGLPAEDLPHLFERFWQARHARRAGAGLGLAIVKGIVEAHHGTLEVTSLPGYGATFTFTLPLRQPETPAASAA